MGKMIIACDFDDTIHDTKSAPRGKKMGRPVAGAVEALQSLKNHHIIIFTVWGGTVQMRQAISDWLDYFNVPYNEITNIKPRADVYIDDRAIRFTNWPDVLEVLSKR